MIVKVSGGWRIKAKNGKKWLSGVIKTKESAEKRLRQIEYFKSK